MRLAPRLALATCALSALLLPSLAGARADEVVLTNGRVLRGQVLRSDRRGVLLQTGGGRLELPRSAIARITSGLSPQAELAQRRAALDASDPVAVGALAEWAAAHGLAADARDLQAQARDLGLEQRVARAQREDSARAFVSAFHWARQAGVSVEVLVYLLEQAQARDPADPELRTARASLLAQLAATERRLAEEREALSRPRYLDPEADARWRVLDGGSLGLSGGASRLEALAAEQRRLRAARAALAPHR